MFNWCTLQLSWSLCFAADQRSMRDCLFAGCWTDVLWKSAVHADFLELLLTLRPGSGPMLLGLTHSWPVEILQQQRPCSQLLRLSVKTGTMPVSWDWHWRQASGMEVLEHFANLQISLTIKLLGLRKFLSEFRKIQSNHAMPWKWQTH